MGLSRYGDRDRQPYDDGQRPCRLGVGRRRYRGRGGDAWAADVDADTRGRGLQMSGQLREGITATDLVLTITQMLRKQGVVGKFVEFFGAGLDDMSVANRATISNMAPEYGATCGFFPVDAKTIEYLRTTGRSDERVALVEAYCRAQGMFRDTRRLTGLYQRTRTGSRSVQASIAGPKRPQDRVLLGDVKKGFEQSMRQGMLLRTPQELRSPTRISRSAMAMSSSPPSLPVPIRRTRA